MYVILNIWYWLGTPKTVYGLYSLEADGTALLTPANVNVHIQSIDQSVAAVTVVVDIVSAVVVHADKDKVRAVYVRIGRIFICAIEYIIMNIICINILKICTREFKCMLFISIFIPFNEMN